MSVKCARWLTPSWRPTPSAVLPCRQTMMPSKSRLNASWRQTLQILSLFHEPALFTKTFHLSTTSLKILCGRTLHAPQGLHVQHDDPELPSRPVLIRPQDILLHAVCFSLTPGREEHICSRRGQRARMVSRLIPLFPPVTRTIFPAQASFSSKSSSARICVAVGREFPGPAGSACWAR